MNVCIIIKSDFTVLRVCCIPFGFTTTVCRAKCSNYCLVSRLFDCPLFMNQDAKFFPAFLLKARYCLLY